MTNAGNQLLGHRARSFDNTRQIEADIVGGETEFIQMMQKVV